MSSASRIDRLLRLFTSNRPEWRVSDIAPALGLSLPTTYRLVNELIGVGYLAREGPRGPVRLGLSLIEIGRRAESHIDIVLVAVPHMRQLSAEALETSVLMVPGPIHAVAVHRVEGTSQIHPRAFHIGEHMPYNAGAIAMTLLAHLPLTRRRSLLCNPLPQFTPNTLTGPAVLEQRCAQIRRDGYAISNGDVVVGTTAVGAPIFDIDGEISAAIGITGIAEPTQQQIDAVVEAAQSTSSQLGHRMPA